MSDHDCPGTECTACRRARLAELRERIRPMRREVERQKREPKLRKGLASPRNAAEREIFAADLKAGTHRASRAQRSKYRPEWDDDDPAGGSCAHDGA